tara:strand:+ start:1255 stop:1536 length:282 start_codon:yes stop_codon:yes gene_type:complete
MQKDSGQSEELRAGVWDARDPGHSELVQLRIRVIALENLMQALLSQSDGAVRQEVRERADEIQSHDDASDHPLTEYAKSKMLKLLARADRRRE